MSLIVNRILLEKFITKCFCGDAHDAGTITAPPVGDRSKAPAAAANFANVRAARRFAVRFSVPPPAICL